MTVRYRKTTPQSAPATVDPLQEGVAKHYGFTDFAEMTKLLTCFHSLTLAKRSYVMDKLRNGEVPTLEGFDAITRQERGQ
jgi:hypothetical protein